MLRAQQWNSQIWLSGWWKASVTRGGEAKRALLTKVFMHNLDIFRDGAYRTETDRVVTIPVGGAFVEESQMFGEKCEKGDSPQFHIFKVSGRCGSWYPLSLLPVCRYRSHQI